MFLATVLFSSSIGDLSDAWAAILVEASVNCTLIS